MIRLAAGSPLTYLDFFGCVLGRWVGREGLLLYLVKNLHDEELLFASLVNTFSDGDQLGDDADPNFLRSLRSDRQTNWSIEPIECFRSISFFKQVLDEKLNLPAAAHQAYVPRFRLNRLFQSDLIVAVSSCDHQNEIHRAYLDLLEA